MEEAEKHLVVISLRKSGTVYVQRALELTLSVVHIRPGPIATREMAIDHFLEQPIGLTGDHLPATQENLRLLVAKGIRRIVLMVRDPRDCLVSWRHHIQRDDVRSRGAAANMIGDGYFDLTQEQQFEDHIERFFPWAQQWLRDWATAIDGQWPFVFHVLRFEDFVVDPRAAITGILRFFGYDQEPVMPNPRGGPERFQAGIHTFTHFRRGVVGSHRDELPPRLVRRLNASVDRALFKRFGWKIDARGPSSQMNGAAAGGETLPIAAD
jgi:hypothetical protein